MQSRSRSHPNLHEAMKVHGDDAYTCMSNNSTCLLSTCMTPRPKDSLQKVAPEKQYSVRIELAANSTFPSIRTMQMLLVR